VSRGSNVVILHSNESLLPGEIHQVDKQSLVEAGLPESKYPFRTDPIDRQPLALISIGSRRLLRLGEDQEVSICLDLEKRTIVAVDHAGEIPERFVNSDLGTFAAFLLRVHSFYESTKNFDDTAVTGAVAQLESDLREIDSPALDDGEHWWALILEQMGDRLV
jgi:hypothetical protein